MFEIAIMTGAAENPVKPVIATANRYTAVDLAACLRIAAGEAKTDDNQCPGFVSTSAAEAMATCKDVGGKLSVAERPSLQSLDVNGDAQSEFLYDFTENFSCDGAALVFSCSSLGCPVLLFEKRDGAWNTIGSLSSYDSIRAEVLAPASGSTYGALRSGCGGARPCDELWYQRWDGSAYQSDTIEVRGHVVQFANEGFWTLLRDMPVLAEPTPYAAVIDPYPQGTEVIVIGTARDAAYKYVSPCRACKNGFIDPTALRKTLWSGEPTTDFTLL